MKFTNGYWMLRYGVDALYARQAFEINIGEDGESLDMLAPTSVVRDRAGALNQPVFEVRVTSPAEGVIRVQARHWLGAGKHPGFPLNEDDSDERSYIHVTMDGDGDGETGQDGATATLTSGPISARVTKGELWRLEFLDADGHPLTMSTGKSLARFRLSEHAAVAAQPVGEFGVSRTGAAYDESDVFASVQLRLGVGEQVYGLGERFGPFVKNGQTVDIWNEDGGTASEQGYKDIPFYLTSNGYGVLVNHRGHVSFEVGSENTEVVQFSVPGEGIDFCVIAGPEPKQVLERYTALTGRPPLVPAWSYGLWLTTSFTTKYDEATVNSFIDGMAERGIPLSAFHYDCYWMRGFQWTDFTWDSRFFPDVEGMLHRLHDKGLHVCAWINPYLAQHGSAFHEAMDHDYLVKKPNGEIWQTDLWQAGMGLVDFTNPQAREWFKAKIKTLLAQGVDAIKTDFGERIPRDVAWHDGSAGLSMHNWYTQLYNRTVFEALEEVRGKGEVVLYARSATVGGQMEPVHWGGDCESTFNGMAQTLRAGLSLCMCGFGFWSHDIGGFEGSFPDSAVYKRWVAFGLLGSHSRLHGSTVYRVPWLFDEEDEKRGFVNSPGQSAVEVARRFVHLKLELMPYLYRKGVEAHEHGAPVMRSMFLEFPHDPAARGLDRQYMLGDSLLVAPVFSYGGEVEYYLPAGVWTNWFTGERAIGGVWRCETHGYDTIPLWVRDGSLIVTRPGADRPDYDYAQEPLVRVFLQGSSMTEAKVSSADGGEVAFTARRTGRLIEVSSSDGRDFHAADAMGVPVASNGGLALIRAE
ncbi:alpha-xylosidase [Bifidobacterium breve]|uniref:alpha-xylosidase n=1 Tax=Bifidobacterium breve TaxID=1685 RepID=UPI0032DEF8E9